MQAQEEEMGKMKIILACPKVVKVDPKFLDQITNLHMVKHQGQLTIILLSISVIFQSKEVLCIASIFIIQEFLKSNIKLFSICVDCNLYPLILSHEKEQLSCYKIVFNQGSLP